MAHDFNNLLVAVRTNAYLLRRQVQPGSSREMLDDIEAASVEASELCTRLLTYAGRSKSRMEPVQLSELLDELDGLMRSTLTGGARLVVELDDVPLVRGDAAQLRQVVMNLILNASEALGDDGGTVAVRTGVTDFSEVELAGSFLHSTLPAGRYVVLEVEDDGAGMDAETRERVFDPFFSTKFTGRGLGLATVLGIVRGHGGAIKVDGAPGAGTRFRVLFPLQPLVERVEEVADVPEAPVAVAPRTILLADDEAPVRRSIRRVLTLSGYDVLEVDNGEAAVEVVRHRGEELDAVLLDITMPGIDGREARKRVLSMVPEMPVLLMSGYDPSQMELDRDVTFLSKPFDPDELLRAVAAAVEDR